MAETVGDIAAAVVAKTCSANECPYRYGDSAAVNKRLGERLAQKIKHRISDGNEVRALENRVAALEKVLKASLVKATSGATFTKQNLEDIKKVLNPPKKKDRP